MQDAIVARGRDPEENLVAMFLYQKYRKSHNTGRAYKHSIEQFMQAVGKPLRDVKIPDMMIYQHSLLQQGYAPATQARAIAAIKSLFKFLIKTQYISFDPSQIMEFPTVVNIKENRFLSKEEVKALVLASRAKRRDHVAISLMLITGARVAEIIAAQWGHIFLAPNGQRGLRIMGKGLKPRTVLVTDQLWELLLAYRKSKRLPTELNPNDSSPLLMNPRGRSLSAVTLNRIVKTAATRAGIIKPVSCHWLRHAHGTYSVLNGAPADLVSKSMGNSIQTLQKYLHSSEALDKSSASYLDIEL